MNFLPNAGYAHSYVGHTNTPRSVGLLGLHRTPKMRPGIGICRAAPSLTGQVCVKWNQMACLTGYMERGFSEGHWAVLSPSAQGGTNFTKETSSAVKGPRHPPSQCDIHVTQDAGGNPHDSGEAKEDCKSQE